MNTDLERKYNMLRGDNYRLMKKLDYYESGKAFESLKAKYEKEIIVRRKLSVVGHISSDRGIGCPYFRTCPSFDRRAEAYADQLAQPGSVDLFIDFQEIHKYFSPFIHLHFTQDS
jgi:hypothetical protein